MTLAIVNVLPEPVTPNRTWFAFAFANSAGEGRDRLRLIAGRLELAHKLEILHASPD